MDFLNLHKLGKNNDHTKRLNRATIIALLRQHGEMSRAALARAMALTMQSVSNIIGGLEQSGLLVASDKVYGGKGQPPTPYNLRAESGYGIGINLDEGRMVGVVVDFAFNVLLTLEHPHDAAAPEQVLREVERLIGTLIVQAGIDRVRIWGIGLASPRLFDENIDDMHLVEDPLWVALGQFDIGARLAAATALPVFVENDANAGALGEVAFGAGKTLQHFCYLHIARGLGCGIIHNRQLFRGAWGNAGEIGRFLLPPPGPERHLESVLSIAGLYAATGQPVPAPLTSAKLTRLVTDNADAVAHWVQDAGEMLRWTISIVENAYDPQCVLLGGQLPEALAHRLLHSATPLHHTIAARNNTTTPRVQLSALQDRAVALGAATIPILATIEPTPEDNWSFSGRIKDVYPA